MNTCTPTIDTEGRTVQDVLTDLNAALAAQGLEPDEYGFSDITRLVSHDRKSAPWPARYRWIAVFAVTGGSEGYYVHIDAIVSHDGGRREERTPLGLAKTFSGMEHALKIASAATLLLGA